MIYIFDIDGTIADLSHRLHFIENGANRWDEFFAACENDKPISEVIVTLRMLHRSGATILLVTGRSSVCREQTIKWLKFWTIPYHGLYMRAAGDHRQDNIVKSELLDQLTREWDGYNIIAVFEDRQQVVDMYRSRGLRVFQVAEGNF